MIAELFYPNDLKGIIADLREKGDLNATALDNLAHEIFVILKGYSALLVLLVILGVVTTNDPVLLSTLFIFPVFLFLCIFDINRLTNICKLFAVGHTTDAHLDAILKIAPSWALWAWSFQYSYSIEGREYKRKYKVLAKYLPQKPHITTNFLIIYNPKKPQDSIPLLPELEQFNPKVKTSDK